MVNHVEGQISFVTEDELLVGDELVVRMRVKRVSPEQIFPELWRVDLTPESVERIDPARQPGILQVLRLMFRGVD